MGMATMEALSGIRHDSGEPRPIDPLHSNATTQIQQSGSLEKTRPKRRGQDCRSCRPIALLIPVFCRQTKLNRTLASLTTEADLLDVIVIDDGSEPPVQIPPQSTLDIHLIRLSRNQGLAKALNAGMEHAFARGNPYIARLDSDDIAVAGRFRKQLAFMEAHPGVGICGSGYHEYNQSGQLQATILLPQDDRDIRRGMHLRTTLCHPTIMLRASVARHIGYFDPAWKAEDIDYFTRALNITRAANLPEPLIHYEVGSSDALTGTPSRRRALAREILQRKWQHREPRCLLWWLGLLAASSYYLGINRWLAPFRNMSMRLVERRVL